MLESSKASLRVMEAVTQSAKFKKLIGSQEISTKYNSIRDRICNINYEFFEQIFIYLFNKYNQELEELNAPTKVDSTYVSLPAKLISWGMFNGKTSKKNPGVRQLKYSMSLKGSLPSSVEIFTEQSFISEDKALSEAITNNIHSDNSIMIVDRGLTSRDAFVKFSEANLMFIIRSRAVRQFQQDQTVKIGISQKPKESTVTIISDKVGKLRNRNNQWTEYNYRIVEAIIDKTGEPIIWITNNLDLDAYQIADMYKLRWEIEVFFKFLKQHLNLTHLVSRTENGMKVMLYSTLILAILLIVFKRKNNIKGYKIAKLKFEIALDNELIKEIVKLCGGNPNKAQYLWNSS